ncbi:MAG: hypothetical protein ACREOI_17290 [bacterium]|jgi:hypothetical protein
MATEKNYTSEELRREAILILNKKLGAFNTYRFLAQVSQSRDDYLKFQDRLFNGQNVDDLYNAAKRHWQRKKR